MIRVLIVDDSALMRQILRETLSSDPDIEVIGVASDPLIARKRIKLDNPDVITLDVEMPRLDGLTFLERLMRLRPMPVVMVSALTQKGADVTLRALDAGAVDFIAKPTLDIEHHWEALKPEVIAKVKLAARASINSINRPRSETEAKPRPPLVFKGTRTVVAVGASTGGVMALSDFLMDMPADAPPILIVQHMPPKFTGQLAERLNKQCSPTVLEATDGAQVLGGHVYLAPGDQHMVLERSGALYKVRLHDGPLEGGHRPAVDLLFDSVAKAAGANAVGVLLTGMGKDGAKGLLAMREAGAFTIGQDEASCLIYGMPKAAVKLGAVEQQLPLSKISGAILDRLQREAA